MDLFKETAETITLHGLGFIQVKLQGGQRLHVWHHLLPRRRCFEHSQIHDHRFSFVSRVLVGTQINRVYRVIEGSTHCAYLHEGERQATGNRPWILDGLLSVKVLYDEGVAAGQEYRMPAFVYHSTHPEGNVATIMQKTGEYSRGAHTLCERGVAPDVDFDRRQWSEAALWNIVKEVLGG